MARKTRVDIPPYDMRDIRSFIKISPNWDEFTADDGYTAAVAKPFYVGTSSDNRRPMVVHFIRTVYIPYITAACSFMDVSMTLRYFLTLTFKPSNINVSRYMAAHTLFTTMYKKLLDSGRVEVSGKY